MQCRFCYSDLWALAHRVSFFLFFSFSILSLQSQIWALGHSKSHFRQDVLGACNRYTWLLMTTLAQASVALSPSLGPLAP